MSTRAVVISHLISTAQRNGRGPKIGGTLASVFLDKIIPWTNSCSSENLHIYNNYWNDVTGHALDADTGSRVLMQDNLFNAVRTPSTSDSTETVFAPTSSSMNAQYSSVISRNCVSNTL
ncbi:unnamed protein product [Rhizoctonia solani]|uniref:Pectate lyase domain-containing protein n=1 Tax=Rhizoctonia solani TaxID=456999 RepID=A0A8H3BIS6_9AGAM|nr:unnamed protein product [Rhizoctonia solani]